MAPDGTLMSTQCVSLLCVRCVLFSRGVGGGQSIEGGRLRVCGQVNALGA